MAELIIAIVIALALFCLLRQIAWPLIKIGLLIVAIGAAVELLNGGAGSSPPSAAPHVALSAAASRANMPLAATLQKANALYGTIP